jgi:hypothetical protein
MISSSAETPTASDTSVAIEEPNISRP